MAAVFDHDLNNFANVLTTPTASKLGYLLYPSIIISILLPAYRLILKDYNAFLALGPGGTPSTFAGYLRVSYLRLFAISDPFQPPSLAQAMFPDRGYLHSLKKRSGPRPVVAGIAPQRQLNQKCSPNLHQIIRQALHTLAAGYPSLLRKGNSCFEKHGLALFLLACPQPIPADVQRHPAYSHLNPTCQDTGEICHLHATVRCHFVLFRCVGRHSPCEVIHLPSALETNCSLCTWLDRFCLDYISTSCPFCSLVCSPRINI